MSSRERGTGGAGVLSIRAPLLRLALSVLFFGACRSDLTGACPQWGCEDSFGLVIAAPAGKQFSSGSGYELTISTGKAACPFSVTNKNDFRIRARVTSWPDA